MSADPRGSFLEYHEPDIVSILILISFFVLLTVSEWLSNKIFRAGLIGQIVVGIIYGTPVGNILPVEWQETFLALGYVGLVLIIFEGIGYIATLPILPTLLRLLYLLLLTDARVFCSRWSYNPTRPPATEPRPQHRRGLAGCLDAHCAVFRLALRRLWSWCEDFSSPH